MIDRKFVRTHLDLNTGHVTEKDMKQLTNNAGPVPCMAYDYGVVVFVMSSEEEPSDQEQLLTDFNTAGYSPEFCALYTLAWEMGVDMIRLDCDAEVCETLPTFDW